MNNYNPDKILPPEDVLKIVENDLNDRGFSRREASLEMGYRSEAFSGILRKKNYLNKKQALKFRKTFGYNLDFLMYGKGALKSKDEPMDDKTARDIFEERLDQEMYQNKLWLISTWLHEFFTKEKNEKGLALLTEINRVIQHNDLVAIENVKPHIV